ncbi:hypothetical protein ACYSNW_05865 [Enterococcus sp. LJL99]
MKQITVDQFERVFNSEKKFFKDGYYRIRCVSDEQKELAFLVVDACGATAVHPQITIEKRGVDWVAIKLIDLETTPPQIINRTSETKAILDSSLKSLENKFEAAIQNFDSLIKDK